MFSFAKKFFQRDDAFAQRQDDFMHDKHKSGSIGLIVS